MIDIFDDYEDLYIWQTVMTKMMREIGVAEDLEVNIFPVCRRECWFGRGESYPEQQVVWMMMIWWFTLVYSPGFVHHHHHVGDDGFVVEDYDCDGNVGDDDDLGVTLVFKDTKRNMDFVSDFKKTGKHLIWTS